MENLPDEFEVAPSRSQHVNFTQIRKRDGRLVPFDASKITGAILKAGRATGEYSEDTARWLTIRVLSLAQAMLRDAVPTVEEIQDIVEQVLLASPFKKTAKRRTSSIGIGTPASGRWSIKPTST